MRGHSRFWSHESSWCAGWVWDDFWLCLSGGRDMTCLDVGHWRIRWAGPHFRPLFSERYGHQKWHRAGRLAARRFDRRGI